MIESAVEISQGEHLFILNPDTAVSQADWAGFVDEIQDDRIVWLTCVPRTISENYQDGFRLGFSRNSVGALLRVVSTVGKTGQHAFCASGD